MTPYSTSGRTRYCRLLPPWGHAPSIDTPNGASYVQALQNLVLTMVDEQKSVCPFRPDIRIPAGLTYFGQLLDHDLTKDARVGTNGPWDRPIEEISNLQSPILDLQVLYGRGPGHPPDGRLYEKDQVRLRVGKPVPSIGPYGCKERSFDLPLNQQTKLPDAADNRSNQHVIIRELTAVFARLHNAAVAQLKKKFSKRTELFYRARLQTVWQYQRLVCSDFLPRILDEEVYHSVFRQRRTRTQWNVFSIPVEFSTAAFRFGHSMVRDAYLLSSYNDAKLRDLLEEAAKKGPLSRDWEIDWARFFPGVGAAHPSTAMPIDTFITKPLHHLSEDALERFDLPVSLARQFTAPSLPFLTLLLGLLSQLPPGQVASRAFGYPTLSITELTTDCTGEVTPQGRILRQTGLDKETPLWFYLLKESEVRNNGNRLGPTGSRIVAETIFAALVQDPNSFVNHADSEAQPPVWTFTGAPTQFRSLGGLFAAVAHHLC
jgi:Animal haem peroxidase